LQTLEEIGLEAQYVVAALLPQAHVDIGLYANYLIGPLMGQVVDMGCI